MVRRAWGRGKSFTVPMMLPWLDGSSQICQGQEQEQERHSWPSVQFPLHCHAVCSPHKTPLNWVLQWPWEITSIWRLEWVTGRQDTIFPAGNWPGLLNPCSDPYETWLPKITDGRNIGRSKHVLINTCINIGRSKHGTSFQCSPEKEKSHTLI